MKKNLLSIITILIFISCEDQITQSTNTWEVPVVIDTLPFSDQYFETKIMRSSFNQLLFIGKSKDTISIWKNDLKFNLMFSDYNKSKDTVDNSVIEVIPDVNQELSMDLEYYSIPPPPALTNQDNFEIDWKKTDSIIEAWHNRSRDYVKAFPVFIRNKTMDTIYLDNQDGELFLIQEAKTKGGEWKPIEYWQFSTCGNSYAYNVLAPNDIIILKKVLYKGSFKTDMRLKLRTGNKIIYSKTFKSSIHPEQLKIENLEGYAKRRIETGDNKYIEQIFLNSN